MRIAGVILTGGRSSRMGQDKASLPYGPDGPYGKARLVDHMAGLLREALSKVQSEPGAPRIVVSGTIEGYETVPDLEPGLGPVGGILSVLSFLLPKGIDRMVVVPVDMPLLASQMLSMLAGSDRLSGSVQAAHFNGSELPFVSLVHEGTLSVARKICQQDTPAFQRSVREYLKRLAAASLEPSGFATQVLTNVNTPEEWSRLRSLSQGELK